VSEQFSHVMMSNFELISRPVLLPCVHIFNCLCATGLSMIEFEEEKKCHCLSSTGYGKMMNIHIIYACEIVHY
jgi:hypothetical protein